MLVPVCHRFVLAVFSSYMRKVAGYGLHTGMKNSSQTSWFQCMEDVHIGELTVEHGNACRSK